MCLQVLAFAKLEWYPPEEVLNSIAEESHAKIKSFSPQASLTLVGAICTAWIPFKV